MSPRQSSKLTLEHVILALIDQAPKHGYDLYQELNEMQGISLIWNIKQPMLYAILDKLEKHGLLSSQLVQGEAYPPRKYFYLTEPGKKSLQTWLMTPVHRSREIRQEFLAKLIIARRYGKTNVMKLIHIQQQACQTWFNELNSGVPPLDQEHLDQWVVYSFRIQRIEALLKWLKVLELKIDHTLQ